jgi:hypothetical protein
VNDLFQFIFSTITFPPTLGGAGVVGQAPDPDTLDSGYLFTGDFPDALSGGWVLIYGTRGDGTTQAGFGGVLNNPTNGEFANNPTCVGSLNMLAQ